MIRLPRADEPAAKLKLKAWRANTIGALVRKGWTPAIIGPFLGISSTRVSQIAPTRRRGGNGPRITTRKAA
jgi:hypothetical protein